MSKNDEIRALLQSRRAAGQHRNDQGQFSKKTVDEVAEQYGIDRTDLRVRALAARRDVQDVEKEVLKLAVQMQHMQAGEADRPSPSFKRASFGDDQERLMQEYIQGSKGLYGLALIRFKMRMREKGLDVS